MSNNISRLGIALAVLWMTASSGAAQTTAIFVNPNGGDWNKDNNWDDNTYPNIIDITADFGTLDLSANANVTLKGNTIVGNMVFGDTGGTIYNWTIVNDTVNPGILTLDRSSGTPTITVNNGTTTINVPLAGTDGLLRAGSGTLVLSGLNSYTGVTTVSNGVLSVSSLANGGINSSIGASSNAASNLVLNGGTLSYTGSGSNTDRLFTVGTTGGTINASGTGVLNMTNTGSVALSGTNTARTVTLSGTNTGANSLAASIGNNGTGATSITKSDSGTWVLSGNSTYSGLTTISTGTLAASSANAFGSTSEIRIAGAGTLSLRGDASTNFVRPSDNSAYSIRTTASGATINVDQATVAGTAAKTMSVGNLATSSTAGTYQVNFTGANNTSLSVGNITGAASAATGNVTISNNISGGGTLAIGNYTSANTGSGETLTFGGSGDTTVSGTIAPSSTTLSVAKSGSGTLTLNGSNTYTGNTTINGGTVVAGNNSAFGTSGTVTLNASNTTVALANGVTINRGLVVDNTGINKTLALQVGASSATYSGNIAINETVHGDFKIDVGTNGVLLASGNIDGTGGAGLTKTGAGTLALAGSNAYSGATTVSAGTLQLGNGGTGGSLSTSSTISVASGAAFSVNQSDTVIQGVDFSGSAITGQGGFTQAGTGVTRLEANNTYTGATNVNAGTLRINGNQTLATGAVIVANTATLGGSGTVGGATTFQSGSTHSPGNSPGLQTFAAGLTYNTGSTLKWELVANTTSGRGINFDGIDVTGGLLNIQNGVTSDLVFDGSLNGLAGSSVLWSDSFWATAQQWLVYQNASPPTFASASIFNINSNFLDGSGNLLSAVRNGSGFSWSQIGNDIFLNYTPGLAAVPEPGTFGVIGITGLIAAYRHKRRRKASPSM